MRRPLLALGSLACSLVLLAGCGGDESAATGGGGSGTSSDPIRITVQDGEITPQGERVEVEPGEITFEVTADTAGELGVHTEPEQYLEFEEGTTPVSVTIEQPGVYEVESHDPDVVVVQLQVG